MMTRLGRMAWGAIGGALAMTIGAAAAMPPVVAPPQPVPEYGAGTEYSHLGDIGYGGEGYFYYYEPMDEGAQREPEPLVFY